MGKAVKTKKRKNWWKYLLAIIILVIYLLPIYVVIVSSLKSVTDHTSRLILPAELYFENYKKVFLKSNILNAIKNTAIIALGVVLIEVFFGCLTAYPMARCKNRMAKLVKMFVLGVMMVPGMSLVVGIYSTLVSINAISTYWGAILVSAAFGLPFPIFMYSNFIGAIPEALDEAAAIDGAGPLKTFFSIIFPQLKPVTISIILIKGVDAWNEYGYSLYILQKPSMYNVTLTVKQFFGEQLNDLNGAAACAVVAIIPIVILYLCLQKYFIQGSLDSAVKG